MNILQLYGFLDTTVKLIDNLKKLILTLDHTVHVLYTFYHAVNRLQVRLEGNTTTNTQYFGCGKILLVLVV